MKPLTVALLALLCGCEASPPPAAEPPLPVAAPAAVAPALPHPVAAVVKAYQAARRKELPAVSAPGVSAGYITTINNLEIAARDAVRRLVHQGGKRTPEALATARAAVSKLGAVLATGPVEEP